MSSPHSRPDAFELIEAVKNFLDDEVRGAVEGQLAFHVRVAANVLAISLRELKATPDHADAHAGRLAQFDCTEDAALVSAIRSGGLDDRYEELSEAIRSMVWDKINVVNPRYVEQESVR